MTRPVAVGVLVWPSATLKLQADIFSGYSAVSRPVSFS